MYMCMHIGTERLVELAASADKTVKWYACDSVYA